jgi:hypothetical protein
MLLNHVLTDIALDCPHATPFVCCVSCGVLWCVVVRAVCCVSCVCLVCGYELLRKYSRSDSYKEVPVL